MIIANNGVVQFNFEGVENSKIPDQILHDTRCVVASFIKWCKNYNTPDELIEQTLVRMIAEGFDTLDKNKMIDLNKEKD